MAAATVEAKGPGASLCFVVGSCRHSNLLYKSYDASSIALEGMVRSTSAAIARSLAGMVVQLGSGHKAEANAAVSTHARERLALSPALFGLTCRIAAEVAPDALLLPDGPQNLQYISLPH